MDATTLELMDKARAFSRSRGLAVRCPVCDAGIGKWCFDPTRSYSAAALRRGEDRLRDADGTIVSHAARLIAAGIDK